MPLLLGNFICNCSASYSVNSPPILEENIRANKSNITELNESLQFAHDVIRAFSDGFAVVESELNQLHKQVEEVAKLKAEIVQ